MMRALVCRADGQVEQIDLQEATPEEEAIAIRDHRELELVRNLNRAADVRVISVDSKQDQERVMEQGEVSCFAPKPSNTD